jgi:citrate lyase beta subunit
MRARRALLYIPGSDWHKLEKATTLDVDSICFDLEDGVALNRKVEARATVARALQMLNFRRSERLVRINAIGSGLEGQDLQTTLPSRPDGIVIPKVADADQIRWVSEKIAAAERDLGWQAGSVCILAMIESARGVLNLPQIAASDVRLQALVFGAEDWAADVGATRTAEGWEVLYARSAVVNCAAAFQLQALDLLFLDFRDKEGLNAEARRGAQLGFAGMQVIHPDQIDPVQRAFTPDDAAIAHARRVLEAAERNREAGAGVFALEGRMVDMPIIRAAERVLGRARAAGKE